MRECLPSHVGENCYHQVPGFHTSAQLETKLPVHSPLPHTGSPICPFPLAIDFWPSLLTSQEPIREPDLSISTSPCSGEGKIRIGWLYCPVCGNKTRKRIREDTVLKNYPLYCPKCKRETLVEVMNLVVMPIKSFVKN